LLDIKKNNGKRGQYKMAYNELYVAYSPDNLVMHAL
jgi:hypothetical protein